MVYVRRTRQLGFANIWNIAVVKYRPPSWWYYCRSYPSDADLKENESIDHTVQDDSPSRTWSFVQVQRAWVRACQWLGVGLSNVFSRLVQVAAWDLGDSRSLTQHEQLGSSHNLSYPYLSLSNSYWTHQWRGVSFKLGLLEVFPWKYFILITNSYRYPPKL